MEESRQRTRSRGQALLLQHCLAFGGEPEPRLPALERLEGAVGVELAQLLLLALSGDHAMPASQLVA